MLPPTHLLWLLQGRGQQLWLLRHRLYRAGQHPLGLAVLPEATIHGDWGPDHRRNQGLPACSLTSGSPGARKGAKDWKSKWPRIPPVPTVGGAVQTASCLSSACPRGPNPRAATVNMPWTDEA